MRRLTQSILGGLVKLDGYFQTAVRPDEPLHPETLPRPWVSALFSALIVGAGQLHNRQLVKAVVAFVLFVLLALLGGGFLGLVWWSQSWTTAGWWQITSEHILGLRFALMAILTCLWWLGVVDAYRTAQALRAGDLTVRYGFKKQGIFALVQWVPYAGSLAPSETITRDEPLQPTTVDTVRGAVGKKLWKRVKRWTGAGLIVWGGGVVILVATLAGWWWLYALGGTVIGVSLARILY